MNRMGPIMTLKKKINLKKKKWKKMKKWQKKLEKDLFAGDPGELMLA